MNPERMKNGYTTSEKKIEEKEAERHCL